MIEQVFCDTSLIIDHINGRNDLLLRLNGQKVTLYINSIVEMELLQGAHDKRELRKIEQQLNLFRRLELQQAVFDQATQWVRAYTLSHRLLLPDAIIAASAYFYQLPLLTYNRKDFKRVARMKRSGIRGSVSRIPLRSIWATLVAVARSPDEAQRIPRFRGSDSIKRILGVSHAD